MSVSSLIVAVGEFGKLNCKVRVAPGYCFSFVLLKFSPCIHNSIDAHLFLQHLILQEVENDENSC